MAYSTTINQYWWQLLHYGLVYIGSGYSSKVWYILVAVTPLRSGIYWWRLLHYGLVYIGSVYSSKVWYILVAVTPLRSGIYWWRLLQ